MFSITRKPVRILPDSPKVSYHGFKRPFISTQVKASQDYVTFSASSSAAFDIENSEHHRKAILQTFSAHSGLEITPSKMHWPFFARQFIILINTWLDRSVLQKPWPGLKAALETPSHCDEKFKENGAAKEPEQPDIPTFLDAIEAFLRDREKNPAALTGVQVAECLEQELDRLDTAEGPRSAKNLLNNFCESFNGDRVGLVDDRTWGDLGTVIHMIWNPMPGFPKPEHWDKFSWNAFKQFTRQNLETLKPFFKNQDLEPFLTVGESLLAKYNKKPDEASYRDFIKAISDEKKLATYKTLKRFEYRETEATGSGF